MKLIINCFHRCWQLIPHGSFPNTQVSFPLTSIWALLQIVKNYFAAICVPLRHIELFLKPTSCEWLQIKWPEFFSDLETLCLFILLLKHRNHFISFFRNWSTTRHKIRSIFASKVPKRRQQHHPGAVFPDSTNSFLSLGGICDAMVIKWLPKFRSLSRRFILGLHKGVLTIPLAHLTFDVIRITWYMWLYGYLAREAVNTTIQYIM